jgi:hypothetical protein
MGDGRYYTYYQFWGIVILVSLSIFVIASTVAGYYRNRGNKNDIQLLHLFLGLTTLIIIKIIEFVIPSVTSGLFLRGLFAIGIFILIFEWFNYLNSTFLQFKKFYNRKIAWAVFSFMALTLLYSRGNLFFKDYHFFESKFSWIYTLCCLIMTVLAFSFVVISAVARRKIHKIYANITITGMLVIFNLLPLLFYTVTVFIESNYIDFAEIYLLFMLACSFNLVMYNQAPSGITVLTFEKIGDIINDYIIVIDLRGKIIYRNRAVLQSDFFDFKDNIQIDHINKIYKQSVILQESDDEEYIHLMDGEDDYYFGHQVEQIINHGEIIGHIITIVDISELVELLHQLRDMKLQAKEINKQLVNYAEVVYNVEKEKEINELLEKILESREDDVKKLIEQIDFIIQEKRQDDYTYMKDQIDYVIEFNKKIIDEVRKTVNSYR